MFAPYATALIVFCVSEGLLFWVILYNKYNTNRLFWSHHDALTNKAKML